MIGANGTSDQLPHEIKPTFEQAGFRNTFVFTCIHLFRIVFILLYQKNRFKWLTVFRKGCRLPIY
ncbi:hypothetical protein JCM10914_3425 [Paenibacillus sp. JCM 10914]|nr:hypothetical protein JCM10914_3425 [Paenibacillus sp. JCM 10914]